MTTTATSRELSDELESLVESYRHLNMEHRRAGTNSRIRRRFEHRLAGEAERFERRLRQAALDARDEEEWRQHFYHGAAPPTRAGTATPIVFRGGSETRSELVIRRLPSGELEVMVDGTAVERLADAEELLEVTPGLTFPTGGQLYRETFSLPDGALNSLDELLATGKPVPGLQALLREGLVGRNLELTPRGRRALEEHAASRGRVTGEHLSIEILIRGHIAGAQRDRLQSALAAVAAEASRPVVHARATLTLDENPALAQPAAVEATFDLGGHVARATARAAEPGAAIDLLVERLTRALRELRRAEHAERRNTGVAKPGSWRHGNLPSHPPKGKTRRAGPA